MQLLLAKISKSEEQRKIFNHMPVFYLVSINQKAHCTDGERGIKTVSDIQKLFFTYSNVGKRIFNLETQWPFTSCWNEHKEEMLFLASNIKKGVRSSDSQLIP